MSHSDHSEDQGEYYEPPADGEDTGFSRSEELTEEQVFLELGLRGSDDSHHIDRLTEQVLSNLSRLDEASSQVLVIESLHGLQLAIGQTAQDTRRIARLLLAHQTNLREVRSIALESKRIALESRQWQRTFWNNVNRLLWLLMTIMLGVLATHIWEIAIPHHETVQAVVTEQSPATGNRSRPGSTS